MSDEPTGRDGPDFRVVTRIISDLKGRSTWRSGGGLSFGHSTMRTIVEDVLAAAEEYIHKDCIDRDYHKECEQTADEDESALRSQIHELEKDKEVLQDKINQLRADITEMRWE